MITLYSSITLYNCIVFEHLQNWENSQNTEVRSLGWLNMKRKALERFQTINLCIQFYFWFLHPLQRWDSLTMIFRLKIKTQPFWNLKFHAIIFRQLVHNLKVNL